MNWITLILGALLVLAPFFSGYSNQAMPLWLSIIGGLLIAIFGYKKSYKTVAICSIILLLTPWIFGFGGTAAATWCWIISGLSSIIGLYLGYIRKEEVPAQ